MDKFKEFKLEGEYQLNRNIKILRFDRGGEYTSGLFKEFCISYGIIRQITLPYTPQQNGVTRQRHRVLLDMVRLVGLILHCL